MPAITSRIELGSPSGRARYQVALVPILLGLVAPAVALLVIDARRLLDPGALFEVYVTALLIIATLGFIVGSLEKPDVRSVSANTADRTLTLERSGLLTHSTVTVPFAEVAAVRMESRYDDDGLQTLLPLLVLNSRESIILPAGTSESDIAQLRALMAQA